jgi:ATP-dependent DNA helicase
MSLIFLVLQAFEERYQRLKFLLDKSVTYAGVLEQHMEDAKLKTALTPPPTTGRGLGTLETRKKRSHVASDVDGEVPLKRSKFESDTLETVKFKQPALVTGARLKDYQLEGVEWMISLDQNGISGILGIQKSARTFARLIFAFLADEMGLGKVIFDNGPCNRALH